MVWIGWVYVRDAGCGAKDGAWWYVCFGLVLVKDVGNEALRLGREFVVC